MQQNSILPLSDKDLFLKELRAVTSPAHKKLEEVHLSKAIVSAEVTIEEYGQYLSKMYAFVSAFEKQLFPLLNPVFTDIESRVKSGWLEQDVDFLKAKHIPLPQILPVQFETGLSQAHLAGAMYVLEGSTLGGKFIYKNINSALSLNAEKGATYFNGYGADTGKQWTSFLKQLCNYATAENQQAVFKGADETFEILFDLLSK